MKYINTSDITYNGRLFRGRKIIGTKETLALIYPLRKKAIFTHGWRSKEEQAEMVKKGVSKTLDSNHRRGVAYDIWNWKEMEGEMKKIGFINDLKPWDPGHFTPGGEAHARKTYPVLELTKNVDEYKPSKKVKKPEVIKMKTTPIPDIVIKAPVIPETAPVVELPKEEPKAPQKPVLEAKEEYTATITPINTYKAEPTFEIIEYDEPLTNNFNTMDFAQGYKTLIGVSIVIVTMFAGQYLTADEIGTAVNGVAQIIGAGLAVYGLIMKIIRK